MTAYYNEIDPYAAQWLRNLIDAGHIAPGIVDERSIEDVFPSDLRGFTQCHFFAGIGVWSHALRSTGWSDDRPVWTGSCPCQPFSDAGKGAGLADERHLWPAWFHLIRECRPVCVYGEQVASRDAFEWWDVVHADLEDARYACGAFDLCAAGVGAPHIRQRLFWLADHHHRRASASVIELRANSERHAQSRGRARRMALAADARSQGCTEPGKRAHAQRAATERGCEAGRVGDAAAGGRAHSGAVDDASGLAGPVLAGFWRDAEWIACRDGKRRPVEPGTFPLAARHPSGLGLLRAGQEPDAPVPREDQGNRVGRLRAYGNSIVAPLAAAFIQATM